MQSNEHDDLIRLNALRVEALYNHGVIPTIVTLFGALVIFFIFQDETLTGSQVAWLVILFVISLVRLFTVKLYYIFEKPPEEYPLWLNVYFIGVILSGSAIGSFVYVFGDNSKIYETFLLTTYLLVLLAGSIGIFSVFQRVYYGFNLPLIVPMAIYLFSQGDELLHSLGYYFCLFAVLIFIIQFQSHRILDELVRIRMDNRNLLSFYAVDQEKIEKLKRKNVKNSRLIKELQKELKRYRSNLISKDQET